MTFKETMKNVWRKAKVPAVAGLAALAVGCSTEFEGKIDDEKVTYTRGLFNNNNNLEVNRQDGTNINYRTYGYESLDLYGVDIEKNNEDTRYDQTDNPEFIAEAQKQFDWYMRRIEEIKDSTKKAREAADLEILKRGR